MEYSGLELKKPTLDCEECHLRGHGMYQEDTVELCLYGKRLKMLDPNASYQRAHCNIFQGRLSPSRKWGQRDIDVELLQIEQVGLRRERREEASTLQKQLF